MYLHSYTPTQTDNTTFASLGVAPPGDLFHAVRWFNHISSFTELERKAFTAGLTTTTTTTAVTPSVAKVTAAVAKPADNDDDFDMFGDEEDDDEVAKRNAERIAAYNAKKALSNKPAIIAKSSILLDCKPWDDETDMAVLEEKVSWDML